MAPEFETEEGLPHRRHEHENELVRGDVKTRYRSPEDRYLVYYTNGGVRKNKRSAYNTRGAGRKFAREEDRRRGRERRD